jgi:hypothetical protein
MNFWGAPLDPQAEDAEFLPLEALTIARARRFSYQKGGKTWREQQFSTRNFTLLFGGVISPSCPC